MPYRLAIPQERETGNVRDLSLAERSKINEKTTHDKSRLTESNRCCAAMTPSAVERIGAVVRVSGVYPYPPLTR